MSCIKKYFNEFYIICKSNNSFGGKLRPEMIDKFKSKMNQIADRKIGIKGFIIKYVINDIKISLIHPNTVIISVNKNISFNEVNSILEKILCYD